MAARMSLCLRRMPYEQFLNPTWHEQMHRIDHCMDCGHCKAHCPYGLDTPALLKKMLADYDEFYKEHSTK
jgi:predicted aldo/keto reductase-like oxidoreductase